MQLQVLAITNELTQQIDVIYWLIFAECGKCKSGAKRLNLNKFCKRDYGKN